MTTTLEAILVDRMIVTFLLGKQAFGIDMKSLIEIREWEQPTPLPGVPAFVRGVANLRGTVVPIVGLAERLGWKPSTLHARSCIVVANIAGKQAGFLVDEIADIFPIGDSEIQPAPDIGIDEPNVIVGLVQVPCKDQNALADADGNMMVLLLDLAALNVTGHQDLAA